MPLFVAPTAFQRTAHPDGELAMARGAAGAGTVMCLSTFATATIEEVAEAAPGAPRWFQLYWSSDRGFVRDVVERAEATGFTAVIVTVDLPRLGRRERDLRTGFVVPEELPVPAFVALAEASRAVSPEDISWAVDDTLTWDDLEWLRSVTSLPVLVKGVLTAEDAVLAPQRPVWTESSSRITAAVSSTGSRPRSTRCRRSSRPRAIVSSCSWTAGFGAGRTSSRRSRSERRRCSPAGRRCGGSAAGGADGVQRVLELLRDELELALALCGCTSPAEVTRAHVGHASV